MGEMCGDVVGIDHIEGLVKLSTDNISRGNPELLKSGAVAVHQRYVAYAKLCGPAKERSTAEIYKDVASFFFFFADVEYFFLLH